MLPLEEKKKEQTKTDEKILRNLMQSAFLSLYPLGSPPATLVPHWHHQRP